MGCSSSKELSMNRSRSRRRRSYDSESDASSISTSASESSSITDRNTAIYDRQSLRRSVKSRSQTNRRVSCSLPTIDERGVHQIPSSGDVQIGNANPRVDIRVSVRPLSTNLGYSSNLRHTSHGSRFSSLGNVRAVSRSNVF